MSHPPPTRIRAAFSSTFGCILGGCAKSGQVALDLCEVNKGVSDLTNYRDSCDKTFMSLYYSIWSLIISVKDVNVPPWIRNIAKSTLKVKVRTPQKKSPRIHDQVQSVLALPRINCARRGHCGAKCPKRAQSWQLGSVCTPCCCH